MFPKTPKGSCRASSPGPQTLPTTGDKGALPVTDSPIHNRSMHRMESRQRAKRPRSRGIQGFHPPLTGGAVNTDGVGSGYCTSRSASGLPEPTPPLSQARHGASQSGGTDAPLVACHVWVSRANLSRLGHGWHSRGTPANPVSISSGNGNTVTKGGQEPGDLRSIYQCAPSGMSRIRRRYRSRASWRKSRTAGCR